MSEKSYIRKRKYDVSFVEGTANGDQLTSAINTRYHVLAEECGGTPYMEIQEVDIQYINKANPTHFKNNKSVSVTNELQPAKKIQNAHTRRYGNNSSDSIPQTDQYISTVKSTEEEETSSLAQGVSDLHLSHWVLFITYDKIVEQT